MSTIESILSFAVVCLTISNILLLKSIRSLNKASIMNSESIIQVSTNLTNYVVAKNKIQ